VIRGLTLALTALSAGLAGPALAADATGHGAVTITEPAASIQVTQNLTFQNLVPTTPTANLIVAGSGASAAIAAAPGASGAPASTPATVSLTGQPGDAVSLSVPAALDLSREGQPAAARVMIMSTQGKAVLITGLNPEGALSVDVGGRVTLAGTVVEPGAYEGLLLVIAQYN